MEVGLRVNRPLGLESRKIEKAEESKQSLDDTVHKVISFSHVQGAKGKRYGQTRYGDSVIFKQLGLKHIKTLKIGSSWEGLLLFIGLLNEGHLSAAPPRLLRRSSYPGRLASAAISSSYLVDLSCYLSPGT